eukprot:jgi/Ulvmu1/4182/UM019_0161.1
MDPWNIPCRGEMRQWLEGISSRMNASGCSSLMHAIQSIHGSASVAGMANLIIALKRQARMIATSALEAHVPAQYTLAAVGSDQIAGLAATLLKHSVCIMIGSRSGGDCKMQALTTLLGHKRTWVAAFGVAAAITCRVHAPSVAPADIILHTMSPWQHMTYEMWHMCRQFQHHYRNDVGTGIPDAIISILQSICNVLVSEGVWQDSSMIWHATAGLSCLEESTAEAIQIIMPVKALMRSAISLAVEWVHLAGQQVLCTNKCYSDKVTRCAKVHCQIILPFMLDMLDSILFKSVHVLLNSNLQSICSLAIFAAVKAAAHKDLMLVSTEVVHLHICVDAVWGISRRHTVQQNNAAMGSEDYRKLKKVFNEVMLANEAKVRQWIRETASCVSCP